MLGSADLMAFVATRDPAAARIFYAETLGLRLVADDPFALAFDANGTELRVQKVPDPAPLPHTVLGWKVADIGEMVGRLAWFKDPDGDLLSLTQFHDRVRPQ